MLRYIRDVCEVLFVFGALAGVGVLFALTQAARTGRIEPVVCPKCKLTAIRLDTAIGKDAGCYRGTHVSPEVYTAHLPADAR